MSVKGLVFSGGGLRGFAFIGCIKALEESNISLKNIEFLAGCYIGAIIATLINF